MSRKLTPEEIEQDANYLALVIAYFVKENKISPSISLCEYIPIRKPNGKSVTLKYAYNFVKKNVKYVDDDLIKSINSNECIHAKLKKDCNKK